MFYNINMRLLDTLISYILFYFIIFTLIVNHYLKYFLNQLIING